MKKRQFLAPLAVSLAALLGGVPAPAKASVDKTGNEVKAIQAVSAVNSEEPLVLTRADGTTLRLADHESHMSHASHASHSSHASHASHYSGN